MFSHTMILHLTDSTYGGNPPENAVPSTLDERIQLIFQHQFIHGTDINPAPAEATISRTGSLPGR